MKTYPMRAALALVLMSSAGPLLAQAVDINLNNDAFRGEFQGRLPNVGARYDLGALVNSRGDEDVVQSHAGLLVTGDAGAREANVVAGLGGRFLLLDAGQVDGGALALGGMVEARLPAFNRLGAVAYAYWAPGASSFGDLDGHFEYALSLDYEVIRNASLYLGYRQVRVDIKDGPTVTADTGFHGGLRLRF